MLHSFPSEMIISRVQNWTVYTKLSMKRERELDEEITYQQAIRSYAYNRFNNKVIYFVYINNRKMHN